MINNYFIMKNTIKFTLVITELILCTLSSCNYSIRTPNFTCIYDITYQNQQCNQYIFRKCTYTSSNNVTTDYHLFNLCRQHCCSNIFSFQTLCYQISQIKSQKLPIMIIVISCIIILLMIILCYNYYQQLKYLCKRCCCYRINNNQIQNVHSHKISNDIKYKDETLVNIDIAQQQKWFFNNEPFKSIDEECIICLCKGSNVKMTCGHIFHAICIKQWLLRKDQCALCRSKQIYLFKVHCEICYNYYIQIEYEQLFLLKLQAISCNKCISAKINDVNQIIKF